MTERTRIYVGPKRKKRDGSTYPKWPYRYKLPGQPWVNGTGTFTQAATRQLVDGLIQDHMIRLRMEQRGMGEPSKAPISTHIADYLKWGKTQGGLGGRPWAGDHFENRRYQLETWVKVLRLETLADVNYDRFAGVNTERLSAGWAPGTVSHHAAALIGLVSWCRKRKRLQVNPLEDGTPTDKRTVKERGAFTAQEFRALVEAAPYQRQVLYLSAVLTGIRRSALAALKVRSVDFAEGTIQSKSEDVKNRKPTVKPIPARLLAELFALCSGKSAGDSLFDFKPRYAAENIHKDMKAAGIPLLDPEGRKRDFHSLKASLGTILEAVGTAPEITQKALDHSSFRTTQTYLKRTMAPLRLAVAGVESALFGDDIFHTQEPDIMKTLQNKGHNSSPIQPGTLGHGVSGKGRNQPDAGRSSKIREFRNRAGTAPISPAAARKLFQHISHTLGDPVFARDLQAFVSLPAKERHSLLTHSKKRGLA